MKHISEITIQLKENEEKVSLHQPFNQKKRLENKDLPAQTSLSTHIVAFIYKHFPIFTSKSRLSREAKLKTVLAFLFRQEKIRSYLLDHQKRREQFLQLIKEIAFEMHASLPRLSEAPSSEEIATTLTTLKNGISLLKNDKEYYLQKAIISKEEQNSILYSLLSRIEREPIESTLEAIHSNGVDTISLITKYMKYKIYGIQESGRVLYDCTEDQTTSSIRTKENIRQGEKGAINQRFVYSLSDKRKIGFYSGELTTHFNVLEQILMIVGKTNQEIELYPNNLKNRDSSSCLGITNTQTIDKEKRIIFTSLFSWNELDLISKQRKAINSLKGKTLRIGSQSYKLNLLYYNIPFSGWNRLPTPAETGAVMNDYNNEALIWLTIYTFEQLHLPTSDLKAIALMLDENHSDYLEQQKKTLCAVDAFNQLRAWLISSLMQVLGHVEIVTTLLALLSKKRPDKKNLKGIDELLYLDLLAKHLGFEHSKNCQNATQRSAGAKAADKAQAVFRKIQSSPFLPGRHNDDEMSLFQSLYSIYLLWEEPEVNALLSTGSDKKYNDFLHKNPETTRYTNYKK